MGMKVMSNYLLNILGIYLCFITSSILDEKLLSNAIFDNYAIINCIQNICTVFVGMFFNTKKRKTSLNYNFFIETAICSILKTISTQMSLYSLKYVNYTLFIISKSCKLIPLLILNFFMLNQKPKKSQFLNVLVLTLGFILFSFNKVGSSSGSFYGTFLLLFSLFLEGISNILQERTLKKNQSNSQFLVLMNFLNLILSFFLIFFHKNLIENLKIILQRRNISYILLSSISSSFGQVFVFSLLRKSSSIIVTYVNLLRKVFSIFISILIFKKIISKIQWIGITLTITSFIIEISR